MLAYAEMTGKASTDFIEVIEGFIKLQNNHNFFITFRIRQRSILRRLYASLHLMLFPQSCAELAFFATYSNTNANLWFSPF